MKLQTKTTESDRQLESIIDQIKQRIIFGRLRPRERLIEDELSVSFNTSRHVIRSAFAELERMGLVTRRPNKGAVVRDFSVQEVEEIYEMRALLQAEAARRIPLPAAPELMARLEALHAQHAEAMERQELQRVCKLNNEFHRTIFEASGNRYLATTIERIWVETLGIRCYAIGDPVLLARSQAEHSEMLEALRLGQRERLVKLVVDHIWPALEAYKRAHGGWSMQAEEGAQVTTLPAGSRRPLKRKPAA